MAASNVVMGLCIVVVSRVEGSEESCGNMNVQRPGTVREVYGPYGSPEEARAVFLARGWTVNGDHSYRYPPDTEGEISSLNDQLAGHLLPPKHYRPPNVSEGQAFYEEYVGVITTPRLL